MEKLHDRTQWHSWLKKVEEDLILMDMRDVSKSWRDPSRSLKRDHDVKALRLLRSRCGRSARHIVERAPTVRQALFELEKQYKPDTMIEVANISYRLDALSPWNFPDLSTYFHKFWSVQEELRDMAPELALPEPYLVAKFLNTLGPGYHNFVYTFLERSRAFNKRHKPAVTPHDLFMAIRDLQPTARKRIE